MKLIKSDEVSNITGTSEFTVVYISAKECQVCKEFTPLVESKYAKERSDIKFYKMDVEVPENEPYLKEVGLDSVPYAAVYHKDEFIGAMNLSSDQAMTDFFGMIDTFYARNPKTDTDVLENTEFEKK